MTGENSTWFLATHVFCKPTTTAIDDWRKHYLIPCNLCLLQTNNYSCSWLEKTAHDSLQFMSSSNQQLQLLMTGENMFPRSSSCLLRANNCSCSWLQETLSWFIATFHVLFKLTADSISHQNRKKSIHEPIWEINRVPPEMTFFEVFTSKLTFIASSWTSKPL